MHHGSCLCGGVRFEILGELGPIVFCHCSQCRKAQGSAFAANAPVRAEDFRILSGADLLAEFESSPGKRRVFCRVCGSPMFSKRDSLPDVVRVRIGTLDSRVSGEPSCHIFASAKAEWFEIHDDLPQHAEIEAQRRR